MRNSTATIIISALAVTAASCAAPPTAAVDAAETAIGAAHAADAAQYAPEDLEEAETMMAALRTELETQGRKFGILRKYDRASELAAEVARISELAGQRANEERERVREETARLMAAATAALEESRLLLAEAPRGKGTEADLAALTSDLMLVETALQSAEQEFDAERYPGAQDHAMKAKQRALQVKAAVEQARESIRPRGER